MTKWKVLVAVGAGMSVLFLFSADAKIKTLGKLCIAKNDTGLKPANNMQSVIGQLSGKCEVLTGINFV